MKISHGYDAYVHLELKHLKLVQAVHEERSITRAGERLHLTQSALSHQLKEIEDRLGTQLFERLRHGLALTPAGSRVLDSASLVLEELRRAEEDIADLAGTPRGSLRISTQCYTAYHWLPQLMKSFSLKHPHVEVEINVDATYRAVDALLEGALDLALTNDQKPHDRLRYVPVFSDELVAVMTCEHPLAQREYLRPRDLGEETVIMPNGLKESYFYRVFLEPAGVLPFQSKSLPLTEAIVGMVKARMGVAVVARWMVLPHLRGSGLKAVRIGKHGLYREWWAVMVNRKRIPKYMTNFIDLIASDASILVGEAARA
jgi:LysR family transcriptional regulator, regulator for metE and metH